VPDSQPQVHGSSLNRKVLLSRVSSCKDIVERKATPVTLLITKNFSEEAERLMDI